MLNQAQPLVSVIIATYDRPLLLCKALESLRRQSYRPMEAIVVDDGSPPSTREALQRWRQTARPDFALRYFRQRNSGPAAARNAGMAMCEGDYVLFLDDDDFMQDDAIGHLVEALAGRRHAAAAMGGYRLWHERGADSGMDAFVAPPRMGPHRALCSMIAGGWFVPIHGYLFNRDALRRAGAWNPLLTSQEDDDFLLAAAMNGVVFYPCDEALVYYRQHGGVRRATPGKPDETVLQGRGKRLRADLAIRESVFLKLRARGLLDAYRPAFVSWRKRLQARYGDLLADGMPQSPLLRWLEPRAERMDSDIVVGELRGIASPAMQGCGRAPAPEALTDWSRRAARPASLPGHVPACPAPSISAAADGPYRARPARMPGRMPRQPSQE